MQKKPQAMIHTPLCDVLGITHPILLAGMDRVANPDLAAAISNAGGLGVIGGFGMTPAFLEQQIARLKEQLVDKNAPFGVDLLIPQVGGSARKTNKDYTKGQLDVLVDIIIREKARLFVSAVGVPPKHIVDRLHAAGIPVMNMIGAPKHVAKALEAGVDMVCAQGGEGGGHTGDIATSILIPSVVREVQGKISPLTGRQVAVVAAGGIFNGKGVAAMLAFGAEAVWVGTRFILAEESGAPRMHREAILKAGHDSLSPTEGTTRTLIFSGRPMRVYKDKTVMDWETNRKEEIAKYVAQGVVPMAGEKNKRVEAGTYNVMDFQYKHIIMGSCAGALRREDVQPAGVIVEQMMVEAVDALRRTQTFLVAKSKM